jgi:hypothetical protein
MAHRSEKKLKPLKQYLDKTGKPLSKSRGAGALIGTFRELEAKGVPMKIRRVKLKPRT